jgi:uncharacterized damage-inducible protein DinB
MFPVLQSRDDILRMLDEMTEQRQKILSACEQLPAAKLNDPVYPGTWSVAKNLAHLAWAEAYMLAWIKKRPNILPEAEWPKEPAADLETLKTAFDEAHAAVIAFLKANPESVLKEKCIYGRAKREETVGGVLFHLIEHEIHHRGFVLHKLGKLQAK